MQVGVISLFPDMFTALNEGIPRIAQEKQQLELMFWNPRDFAEDKRQTVDDTPYGGGPGMVMKVEPLRKAIQAARKQLPKAKVIYLSPQGERFNHQAADNLAKVEQVILLCGRYEGIDERLVHLEVDAECSIGDYVLSGGELAAMVMIDAIARLLPNVLGDAASASEDSFATGLLDYPHYTKPSEVEQLQVPKVLLNGNHQAINQWRLKQALGRTWQRRPELLQEFSLSVAETALLDEFITETKCNQS